MEYWQIGLAIIAVILMWRVYRYREGFIYKSWESVNTGVPGWIGPWIPRK